MNNTQDSAAASIAARPAGKYRLAIGNVIEFPVKGSIKDGGRHIAFGFMLIARRLELEELRDVVTGRVDVLVRDFLQANVSGWRGQRLVLDQDAGQPADFCAEAFDALLDISGMEQHVYLAYLSALQISETDAGRRGN